ncbi:probable serine/threonine-protein kinase yakA [Drosophila elegans]|uniref:probable serine/threonine-protein kinase yakA n=1 Tax=Drosophila elegans TaxID=30023 RepID=UPI0007E5F0E2|nr:probable serine/threonine-protein kinase yakA [Drosophila elegans]
MINGFSVGGGQQVTPAGAAIKLHFANSNNNKNTSNISSSSSSNNNNNYSGLKTAEQKMSNNNKSNNNNNTGEVLKIYERMRNTSGASGAATSGSQGSASFVELSTASGADAGSETLRAVGFIQGSTIFSKSASIRALSPKLGGGGGAAARPSGVIQESGVSTTSRGISVGSGAILESVAPMAIGISQESGSFMNYQTVAPRSAISYSRAVCKAVPLMGVRKRSGTSTLGTGTGAPSCIAAAKGVSPIGASSLRWLSMPVSNEKSSNAGGAETKVLDGATENTGSPVEAAKSALANAQPQRTEDQENAFRRIEDVHNYAKLQDYSSDTDDEEDDDEEEELDEEEEDEEVIQVPLPVQQEITRIRRDAAEEHVDVDVVTVPQPEQDHDHDRHQVQRQQQQQQQQDQPLSADNIRPEHHARRPMNAFLIFCKRHRGIVKERYKTLENRAITKILGDWWAALDEQEKHCFTDLAQQNKDAFFNANPNFKWYKLPAPPLRTLATRPSNTAAGLFIPSEDQQQQQQQQQQLPTPLQLQWAERGEMPRALLRGNYFKLADETQMGDLSSLLQVHVQEKDYALQQVLSETSQFLSAHMPGGNPNGSGSKRSLPDSNSSNSSEEEAANGGSPSKKAKSSRSCKGKIYQELVNSGQLAAIAKKSKARSSPPAGNMGGNFVDIPLDAGPNTPPVSPPERHGSSPDAMQKHVRTVSESSSSGFFDLEEKIKELPALSLDAYLQRKRSTKKKKKFSGSKKQRNSSSASGGSVASTAGAVAATDKGTPTAASEHLVRIKQQQHQQHQQQHQHQQHQQQLQVVGSQRRKARKESITRRDVSAIEQEVASILPLTINGSYYFNQSGAPKAMNASVTSSSASPPLSSNSSSSSSSLSSQAAFDVTSSTSDLLILAEVAANRTELTKSN